MPRSRFITIHGHFYQPPRENPWLEAVETQDSAFPWHDWNERITVECYEPNASARILDEHDRIRRIVNNYASISFNFGPTLLSWLEVKAPETYAAILEADRASGSAIAQAYNHVILPLASARDQRTQVVWGVRDFEHRFGRKPQGMWLPETAVDVASLEALAAEGIAFTILEPHQTLRWRALDDEEWLDTPIDPSRPYVCNLPSGASITIFFYDGPISRAVAFEHLLARGENFAHRLRGAFREDGDAPQLVSIATDGETYGHHHRYGEMALAYALELIEQQGDVTVTSYNELLAASPPEHEVEIRENTSWSCAHGIERWRADCGCNAGAGPGWNQQWRAPLRAALDWLRTEVDAIFQEEGRKLFTDPWQARDAYIDVILDRSKTDEFLTTHSALSPQPSALLLLELQRNAMLMYTSCGWFFSDVSGIETVQVLHYAARVIQVAERISGQSLEPAFIERLAASRSNLAHHGTAREIYERDVIPARLDLERVAAHYAVLSLFDTFDEVERVYCYEVTRRDFGVHKAGRARLAIGSVEVRSTITRESAAFELAVLHLGETELTGGVRPAREGSDYQHVRAQLARAMQPGAIPSLIRLLDQHFGDAAISIRSLFRDEQRRILHELLIATLSEAESTFRQLHERYDPLMRFHNRLGIPVPKVLQTAAEFDVNVQLRRLLAEDPPPVTEIDARLRESREERVTLDETTLLAFSQAINRTMEAFHSRPGEGERLEALAGLVGLVREPRLAVDLRRAQNRYYRMRQTLNPESHDARWRECFDALGARLSIATEELIRTDGPHIDTLAG